MRLQCGGIAFLLAVTNAFTQIIPTPAWTDVYSSHTTINGQPIPRGLVIEAFDPQGVACGAYTISTPGSYGYLHVYGDDPTTSGVDEGALTGDTITFAVFGHRGVPNSPLVWQSGTPGALLEIDLQFSNQSPVFISKLRDTTIYEYDSLSAVYTIFDADADSIDFHVLQKPSGAVLADSGSFYWKVTQFDVGLHYVIVSIGDPFETIIDTVRITVLNLNDEPQFTGVMPDTTIAENDLLIFQYQAVDINNDTLHFSLLDGPAGVVMSETGHFSWQPTFTQAGLYSIIVAVSDKYITIPDTAIITVTNVNRAPSAPRLSEPIHGDTIDLLISSPPLRFSWTQSIDPDKEDTLLYTFTFWGTGIDTTISGLQDSTLLIAIMPYLQIRSMYYWTISVSDGKTVIASPDTFSLRTSDEITNIRSAENHIPLAMILFQNYPNPFNPATVISYELPAQCMVTVKVYNLLGKEIATIENEIKEAGRHHVQFHASNLASGVYLYKINAGTYTATRKFVLLK